MQSASAGIFFSFSQRWVFPQEQNFVFLFPCSTVIPCVCLREECALGSFQHLRDQAGRRRHSESCSRMPHSHPLDRSLTNKDCSVCERRTDWLTLYDHSALIKPHSLFIKFDLKKKRIFHQNGVKLKSEVSFTTLYFEWQQSHGETKAPLCACSATVGHERGSRVETLWQQFLVGSHAESVLI